MTYSLFELYPLLDKAFQITWMLMHKNAIIWPGRKAAGEVCGVLQSQDRYEYITVTWWVCLHTRQDSWWTATTLPAQCPGNLPSANLLWAWISLQKIQAWLQCNNLVVLSSGIVRSQRHIVELCWECVPGKRIRRWGVRSEYHSHSMGTLQAFLLEREKMNGYKQLSFLEASLNNKACSHVPYSNLTLQRRLQLEFSVRLWGLCLQKAVPF